MAVRELAWKGDPKVVKLPKHPTLEEILPEAERLANYLHSLSMWTSIGSSGTDKQMIERVRLVVHYFGFEPFEGKLYRGFQIRKGKPMPEAGKVMRLNVALRPVSSWTTKPGVAKAFTQKKRGGNDPRSNRAAKMHNERYQGGVVVELQDKGYQLLNMRYLASVAAYIFSITRGDASKKLMNELRECRKAGDKRGEARISKDLSALISLRVVIERLVKAMKGWRYEDEVVLQLKNMVRVKVVETIPWE